VGAEVLGPAHDDAAAPLWRLFESRLGHHLLVVPYTRLFDVPADAAAALRRGDASAVSAIEAGLEPVPGEVPLDVLPDVGPQSISLNVSNVCNLSCGYCFAGRGRFGGAQASTMTWSIARAAVDRLLDVASRSNPVTIGFIGGEPFTNRALLGRVVEYAAARGAALRQDVRFSVTTNGTLLGPDDVSLLRAYPFAVTVSVDGERAQHDGQRPSASGTSSFDEVCRSVGPLLADPGRSRVAARATVARPHLELRRRFKGIAAIGFQEIGFAPVRTPLGSPLALVADDWPHYLAESIALARDEVTRAVGGEQIRFSNLAIALKQLHRGASSPYPCGAGGGYFSIASDGTWYACHRAIGQDSYALGDSSGLDDQRRRAFQAARHVHAHAPCRSCWARYLCSGGCHQEAASRSIASCDFVRGWLDFCLTTYCELTSVRPDYFADSPRARP
jgi:uncharacterized protein